MPHATCSMAVVLPEVYKTFAFLIVHATHPVLSQVFRRVASWRRGRHGDRARASRAAVKGLSEVAFRDRFGTAQACRGALFEMRWREGLTCPHCGHRAFFQLKTGELFQCNRCQKQVRLTAGTLFQDSKLPLTSWFAAL